MTTKLDRQTLINILYALILVLGIYILSLCIPVRAEGIVEPLVTPQATLRPDPLTRFITVRVSHYWPDLGGVNCANFKNGHCISKLANGQSWKKNAGIGIACPKELSFGTKIRIGERIWICSDRGSKIIKDGNDYWVDMLLMEPLYPYGTRLEAEMYLK